MKQLLHPRHAQALWAMLGLAMLAPPAMANDPAATQPGPVELPRSKSWTLKADDGYVYQIHVAEPKEPPPKEGYGVLYVLDANPMFLTAVEATRFQKGLLPTIVVGIGARGEGLDLTRRFWDFTPPTPAERLVRTTSSEGAVTPEGTGGQDAFLNFIEQTLKPRIAGEYPIDATHQALFGHSLSARFVLHVLATRPDAFETYLASSPSIWWDGASVLEELKQLATHPRATEKRVLITVGEFEQKPTASTTKERAEFFAKVKMVDNARTAADLLKSYGVKTSFYEYADENHGSVVPLAISRGVRIAFAPRP